MQANTAAQLSRILSPERLDAYRQRLSPSITDDALLGTYLWNMALAESLYPALQTLEIALRNAIHDAACNHFKSSNWLVMPGVLQHSNEREAVQKAISSLTHQQKPHDAGRVVAELSFGFWTSLMDRRYEQSLWPRLLKPVFPYLPRSIRTRAVISRRFHRIRQLRNRIFHHEPVWYWQDLVQHHQEVMEALGWIEPAARNYVGVLDRFNDVYAFGAHPLQIGLAGL